MRAGRAAAVLPSSLGAAVLAQQAAQPGCHYHLSVTIAERGIAGRWPKVETAVGTTAVAPAAGWATEIAVQQPTAPCGHTARISARPSAPYGLPESREEAQVAARNAQLGVPGGELAELEEQFNWPGL